MSLSSYKITPVMCLVVFCTLGIMVAYAAQTAEYLDRTGLEHFRVAFYELTPKKDAVGASREYELAEKAFLEAIRQAPDWVEPYLHLGRTYFVQKKYHEAAELYRQALKMAPERREIYLQLASSLEMAQNYQQAIEVLVKLRYEEPNEKSVGLLDEFIHRLEKQAAKN